MGIFSKDIGIDLGTANTLVYVKGKGIVVREPSVVAIDKYEGKVLAVGNAANEMIGRTPENIVAVRPMKDGVIADFDITQAMIRAFIKEADVSNVFKPRVVVCIPSGITEVERRAVEEAVIQAGAKAVALIEEPMAAAMGAGLPVNDATGNMVVDIGGGTTEVAVISLGGIVSSRSIRIAGNALDRAIINYLKKENQINIGDKMAEDIKVAIASAYEDDEEGVYEVRGRDVATGLPKTAQIKESEIRAAISENVDEMIEAIKLTLENTPPELAADVMERGIVLTGGGALIKGLDKLITETTKIPTHVAEYPLDCVAIGTGKALDNIKGVIAAAIITVVVLVCAAIAHFGGTNPVSKVLRTVFSPFQNGFSYIVNKVTDTTDFIREMNGYKEENARLVGEINELKKQNKDVANYREENERLKETLELQNSLENYSTVAASVIAYSSNNWYDTIQISKGSLAGVAVGNAVITPDGVVGKVVETGPTWSIVSTILNPDNAMGVKVSRTSDVAVVEGDSELYSQNYCKMTFIDKGSNLIIGDILETSGSGGIYPAGLSVGVIREINSDAMGNLNYATVEPLVDFNKLYEVLVINGTY